MKNRAILLCIAAVILGIGSPFAAGAFANSPLHAWFYLLPTAVDQWLWPEGDLQMVALAMAVFTIQYLALFAVATAAPPLIRIALDFLSPPRHRRGLMRPRR
jgi:hypothetical protein